MKPWEYGKADPSANRRGGSEFDDEPLTANRQQTSEQVQLMPCPPWELERLLAAASSDLLHLDLPGVPDVQLYTLAWGSAYLTGDRDEALRRLWEVYKAWKKVQALAEARAA